MKVNEFDTDAPLYCVCSHPTVEKIPLFNTAQCGECKRPFRKEMQDA